MSLLDVLSTPVGVAIAVTFVAMGIALVFPVVRAQRRLKRVRAVGPAHALEAIQIALGRALPPQLTAVQWVKNEERRRRFALAVIVLGSVPALIATTLSIVIPPDALLLGLDQDAMLDTDPNELVKDVAACTDRAECCARFTHCLNIDGRFLPLGRNGVYLARRALTGDQQQQIRAAAPQRLPPPFLRSPVTVGKSKEVALSRWNPMLEVFQDCGTQSFQLSHEGVNT